MRVGVGASVPPVQLVRIDSVNILGRDGGSESCQGELGYHCGLKYRDCHTQHLPGTSSSSTERLRRISVSVT